ncbi:hypothetical protein J6D68_001291 [Salmonella enterica subsp. enterica]|nr:hypothetical protein [Salmonella enterica subsp. enterica]
MNTKEKKLKALADARRRANLNVRTTSSASTTNDQSEVAESPPTVYQVPNINVPENLEEAARLIQSELQKISQSQSVLLTLWEKLKSQAATATGVEFAVPISAPSVTSNGVILDNGASFGVGSSVFISQDDVAIPAAEIMQGMIANYGSGFYRYNYKSTDINGWNSDSCGFFSRAGDTSSLINVDYNSGVVIALAGNDAAINSGTVHVNELYGTANPPGVSDIEGIDELKSDLKWELYTELQKLNAGLIVPIVINPE